MIIDNFKFVISAQWLLEHINNSNIVIIDCRFRLGDPQWGYQQYLSSHIPGAYYLDLDQDLSASVSVHGGRHPLPETLSVKLNNLGIDANTLVVAYDDARFAFAARLWWLLRYLGHDRVVVLDGGFEGWLASDYPVTTIIPQMQQGRFIPQFQVEKLVNRETIIASQDLDTVILVDSRERDRYLGKLEPIDPIAGHIPGALNFPYLDVSTPEGYFRSTEAQQQIWANLPSEKEIIVYCGSGVTACVNLLSLESLGITKAKLYPGGWSDWCSYLLLNDSFVK